MIYDMKTRLNQDLDNKVIKYLEKIPSHMWARIANRDGGVTYQCKDPKATAMTDAGLITIDGIITRNIDKDRLVDLFKSIEESLQEKEIRRNLHDMDELIRILDNKIDRAEKTFKSISDVYEDDEDDE